MLSKKYLYLEASFALNANLLIQIQTAMAKNTGIIKIQGLLDGNVFYRRNGKDIIQTKGGFDGTRIKSEERYEKTRQLGTEFGNCARQASAIKAVLQPFLSPIPDPYIYNWIQSLLVKVKNCDTSSGFGARNAHSGLQTVTGKKLLENFQFNRLRHLNTVLQNFSFDLDTCNLTITANAVPVLFPKSASHAAVQLVLLRLDLKKPDAVLALSENYILPHQLAMKENLILNATAPQGDGILIGLVSVRFANQHGDSFTFQKSEKNVLGIVSLSDLSV